MINNKNKNDAEEDLIEFQHGEVPIRVLYPTAWKNSEGRDVAELNSNATLVDASEGVNDDLEVVLWFNSTEEDPNPIDSVDMSDAYSFDRLVSEFHRSDSPGDSLIAFTRPLPR